MRTKIPLIFMIGLLLAACAPKAGPTPSGTLLPISTEIPTAISSQVPVLSPTLEPTLNSTLEATPSLPGLSDEVEIEIEDFAFTPATVTVKVGMTVKWSNKDKVQHTVTGDDGTWGSAPLNKGDDFLFTFTQEGTYTYHCSPHRSMTGTIVVVSS
jgi:plastocyanin